MSAKTGETVCGSHCRDVSKNGFLAVTTRVYLISANFSYFHSSRFSPGQAMPEIEDEDDYD
jgi:hypothetical protein